MAHIYLFFHFRHLKKERPGLVFSLNEQDRLPVLYRRYVIVGALYRFVRGRLHFFSFLFLVLIQDAL